MTTESDGESKKWASALQLRLLINVYTVAHQCMYVRVLLSASLLWSSMARKLNLLGHCVQQQQQHRHAIECCAWQGHVPIKSSLCSVWLQLHLRAVLLQYGCSRRALVFERLRQRGAALRVGWSHLPWISSTLSFT